MSPRALAVLTLGALVTGPWAFAADPSAAPPLTGTRRALIVCGLTGDADRHKQYGETLVRLHEALTTRWGFSAGDVDLLFGDEPADDDPELLRNAERSTREHLEQRIAALRERLVADDALWVIVIGHSHYDGRLSWLSLPGPDMHQEEFAKLFAGIEAREQVFFITTPTSGFYVRPLKSAGRVVITATEADWETNETEFPHELARTLGADPAQEELDVDRDGKVSLFDVYIVVVRNLAQSYLERELLATEHALIDDDGDGRGTEVQIDYLTVDQGGRLQPNRPFTPPVVPRGDGRLAKTIAQPPRN